MNSLKSFSFVYQALWYGILLLCINTALLVTAIIKTSNTSTGFVADKQVNARNSCRSKLIKPHQNNYLVQPGKQRPARAQLLWKSTVTLGNIPLKHFGSLLSETFKT